MVEIALIHLVDQYERLGKHASEPSPERDRSTAIETSTESSRESR
jgi:hypothetical protein